MTEQGVLGGDRVVEKGGIAPESREANRRRRRRSWSNKLAGLFISLGGAGVVVVVAAIFVFIGNETIPLWSSPRLELVASATFQEDAVLAVGENEYRSLGYAITAGGVLILFDPATGSSITRLQLSKERIASAAISSSQRFAFIAELNGDGSIFELPRAYDQRSEPSSRTLLPLRTFPVGDVSSLVSSSFVSSDDGEFTALLAGLRSPPRLIAVRRGSLFSGSTTEVILRDLPWDDTSPISTVAVDGFAERAVAGTEDGRVHYWDIRDVTFPRIIQSLKVSDGIVTALEFLLGGQVLIAGDTEGGIRTLTWALDSVSVNGISLVPLNEFDRHSNAVTAIAAGQRNKTFLTADSAGEVFLHYQTGGRTLLKIAGRVGTRALSVSPRGDGVLVLDNHGTLRIDSLFNPHPEASLKTLFGRIQYEGYDHSTYTWQSTGGTDDFEPKLSLVPLVFGTLKGAVYAMLFALPVAVLAALYTALFAHPKIKTIVKPVVEIMAALPSVVIGFIAALWLAPLLETRFVDVAMMVVLFPLSVFVVLFLWRLLPARLTNRFLYGSEILLLVPILAGFMILGTLAAAPLEAALFGGSFRQWLFETAHITYDQRNSIVVAFAMGFAVIPIIFTISEDALSSVPAHLTAGSLALGATRWQTATRVVLPTASPGIFSAAMIGFGRAVGETMIVLMATGNTPILDFSPFVGMRTLSANIAVEIPEAPYLGTLYRVLFFSGLLLFAFTFFVNTIAELIRQRLRKRYSTI